MLQAPAPGLSLAGQGWRNSFGIVDAHTHLEGVFEV